MPDIQIKNAFFKRNIEMKEKNFQSLASKQKHQTSDHIKEINKIQQNKREVRKLMKLTMEIVSNATRSIIGTMNVIQTKRYFKLVGNQIAFNVEKKDGIEGIVVIRIHSLHLERKLQNDLLLIMSISYLHFQKSMMKKTVKIKLSYLHLCSNHRRI